MATVSENNKYIWIV